MGDEDGVKVAVRVRPFNSREKERNAELIIEMNGNQTTIRNPSKPDEEPRKFTFDYSYWSHDGFEEKSDGLLVPVSEKYADQRGVFNDLGAGVLKNAFEGFNTSLFAYGQTGSGKSFSMVGYGVNKGIVPITCLELFAHVEQHKKRQDLRFQVTLSMLEIYNEQVRDLLEKSPPKGGLPVRENTKEGRFFVQGLRRVPVTSYPDIERRIAEGTSNRTLAATKMNATSSRAHTVVTIKFEQISRDASTGKETTKESEINLVDLAGSERASSTGATGDRLKEGSAINQSLSSLGNVISALAANATSSKKTRVPYRDSTLTKLLANALGGNSKTIMIAALSPADINYDETLSTLRYADRAKQIKNKAVVNESPTDKLIRMLKEENDRLRQSLSSGGPSAADGAGSDEEMERLRQELENMRAQLEENTQALQHHDQQQNDKAHKKELKREEKEEKERQKKIKNLPHLVNLNEDPILSGVVYHFLERKRVVIGKDTADPLPDLPLSGLSIRREHAVITLKSKKEIRIAPGQTMAHTKVNGLPLTGEIVLHHNDRVLFGSNHMYVFKNPKHPVADAGSPEHIDWDFAQYEIANAKGYQTSVHGLTPEQVRTQEQILELLPLVAEANAISEEMNKQHSFEVVLIPDTNADGTKGTAVQVKMKNLVTGNEWLWDRGKFIDRRFQFQGLYYAWVESDEDNAALTGLPKNDSDPFYEDSTDLLIGSATIFLSSLAYAMDHSDTLNITDYKGEEQGSLSVELIPCTKDGEPLPEETYVDDPSDLIGQPYSFKVRIISADIHQARFASGLKCSYQPFLQEKVETPTIRGTVRPVFDHEHQFHYSTATQPLIEWFETGLISVQVYTVQKTTRPDVRRAEMDTAALMGQDQQSGPTAIDKINQKVLAADNKDAEVKFRLKQVQQLNDIYKRREARIKELLTEWGAKPKEEQSFDGFHRAISAAVHGGNKFRQMAILVTKINIGVSIAKGRRPSAKPDMLPIAEGADPIEVAAQQREVVSKACAIM